MVGPPRRRDRWTSVRAERMARHSPGVPGHTCSYAEGLLPGLGELGRVGLRYQRAARVDLLDELLALERRDRRLDAEVCHMERRLGNRRRGLAGQDELGHL